MNLRIADSAGLVAFLYQVISDVGEVELEAADMDVIRVGETLFFHGSDPVSVGGPFPSLEALVRSEGVCLDWIAADVAANVPDIEIFEWAGGFFRIEGPAGPAKQFDSLRLAREG